MSFYVTTFCYGNKYEPIKEKWLERIKNKCNNSIVEIYKETNNANGNDFRYAWWDLVRLQNNLNILIKNKKPVVHIDLDLIIEKDIEPLVNLSYDLIISKEIGENGAYPKECSSILGLGVCTGFYILKPTAVSFMNKIYTSMKNKLYNSFSDQVNIMKYIINNNHKLTKEEVILDNITYINTIIEIDNIKICILDFNIITRDPIVNKGQFGNHINIDNVGGTQNFLKYFDNDLETLPLTCRCGKTHLGDNNICSHIKIRNKIEII